MVQLYQFNNMKFLFLLHRKQNTKGASLIEVLVTMGLASILLPAIILGLMASRDGKAQQKQRQKAVTLIEEAQEVTRNVRDADWSTFAINGVYYPRATSSSSWELVADAAGESIDGFTRKIKIEDVYRNNGSIVAFGGILDPSTKKVTTTVSWNNPLPTSVIATMYLTRYIANDSYTETTQTEFNAGTKKGVTIRATSGSGIPDDGEIVLGSGGYGDWCNPNLTSSFHDLDGQGVSSGIWAVEGLAFLATGENASGPDFMKVGITNPSPPAPPSVTSHGTYDEQAKSNDVFGEVVGSTYYAYLATDQNKSQVIILNATNNTPSVISRINVGSNATSLYVANNILYVLTGSQFKTYDISNKSTPISKGQVSLSATGVDVTVAGEYAFVALNSTARQLEIIKVTNNGATLTKEGYAALTAGTARALHVNDGGTRVYLATANSTTQREFFIINTETKSGNRPVISSYDTNGMDPRGVTVVPGNRAIVVGHGGNQYQVININNENNITPCGSLNTGSDHINGIASILDSEGSAYSYLITTNSSREFAIVVGGPGGAFASTGEYESVTLAPPLCSNFCANNRLSANFHEPPGTNITFQVALANKTNDVCPANGSYTFVGPNGTSDPNDVFDPPVGAPITFPFGTVPPSYTNPGQCFRYKAYFTTSDSGNTPVLYDVTLNYSP